MTSTHDVNRVGFIGCLQATAMPIRDIQRYFALVVGGPSTEDDRLALLEIDDSIVVVREAKNGEQAVEMWRTLRSDVVVLDHMMPIVSGVEAARQILDERPEQRIVLFSALASDPAWIDSLDRLGVSAILT